MIVAQNASFSWVAGSGPIVRDVSFTLRRNQFCFIIGPVGSGKSTLLKGLLGETPSSQGFVYSSFPTTAYVDQTPWIQNGTIQQNILGVSTYDEPWYRQVVRALCARARYHNDAQRTWFVLLSPASLAKINIR